VYATGAFANSSSSLVGVILPLWLVHLGAGPAAIGFAIGSRQILPLLLSIHGGAMMDRLGTRRVMIGFAWIGAIAPILYPIAPWLWAIVILQTLCGLSASMGWIGAQTMIGQAMRGHAVYAGRLSFTLRLAQLVGPLLAGVVWDAFGPVAAFTLIACWGGGLLVSAALLPNSSSLHKPEERVKARDVVPRLSDYLRAFEMLLLPGIAVVMVVTYMRISAEAMQMSFYTVYLNGTGFSGTEIGALIAVSAIIGSLGTLAAGWASRRVRPIWLLFYGVVGSITFMAITPSLPSYPFLMAIGIARGIAMGLSQPLMISILFNCVPPNVQGTSVGLRTTVNRAAAAITPLAMGGVAEFTGIATSFYLIGGALLAAMAWAAVAIRRNPAVFEDTNEPSALDPSSRPLRVRKTMDKSPP
jgi:MFS family permease